jgi:hypothetical protein
MRPLVLALLMLAVWPLEMRGQNYSASALASVASSVTAVRLNDLSFGATAIVPGTAASVAPANGARVRVDFNEPTTVTAPNFLMIGGPAGATLRVDLVCAQDASAAAAAPTAFGAPCAGGFIPPIAGNVGGTHYIFVGATVGAAASASAVAGNYAGSFSVTASFVSY